MSDIAQALGAVTDATDLGRHPAINKWAKYRSYRDKNLIRRKATDEDRKANDWGIDSMFEFDSNDFMLRRFDYRIELPAEGEPCRMGDFDGYSHEEKCGFSFTIERTTASSPVFLQVNGPTGLNIAWDELWQILHFDNSRADFETFGVELRAGESIPLTTVPIGSFEQLKEALTNGITFSLARMAEVPVLTNGRGNGEIFIYAQDDMGDKLAVSPSVVVSNNATSGDALQAFRWNPDMKIGSNLSELRSLNQRLAYGDYVNIGIGDTLLFDGPYFRNGLLSVYPYIGGRIPHIAMEYNGRTGLMTLYAKLPEALQPTEIAGFGTLGDAINGGEWYVSGAAIRSFLADYIGQRITVKIYLNHFESIGNVGRLTPPVELPLFISNDSADLREQFPEFPPIEDPDWSGGFDI